MVIWAITTMVVASKANQELERKTIELQKAEQITIQLKRKIAQLEAKQKAEERGVREQTLQKEKHNRPEFQKQ